MYVGGHFSSWTPCRLCGYPTTTLEGYHDQCLETLTKYGFDFDLARKEVNQEIVEDLTDRKSSYSPDKPTSPPSDSDS